MRKDSQRSPGIPWVQWIVSVRVNLWHVRWIFNLHAPATIRSLTPSVSGSKFLVAVLYCATDHTTLLYLYLIIYSCHHLLSALSHSAQLEKQSPAACWVFGISARCLKWTFFARHTLWHNVVPESETRLTVSLHCGDEVSVQEEVHVGEIWGGSPVHHHVVQNLRAHAQKNRTETHTGDYM